MTAQSAVYIDPETRQPTWHLCRFCTQPKETHVLYRAHISRQHARSGRDLILYERCSGTWECPGLSPGTPAIAHFRPSMKYRKQHKTADEIGDELAAHRITQIEAIADLRPRCPVTGCTKQVDSITYPPSGTPYSRIYYMPIQVWRCAAGHRVRVNARDVAHPLILAEGVGDWDQADASA